MKNENNYFFIQHFVDDFFKNNIIINHEITAKEFKKILHSEFDDSEFCELLIYAGYIPDMYLPDSSEETLFSKLIEVIVCEWCERMGFVSNFVKQKASYEDVNFMINGKVIVCDAKSFRLGRSQKAPNVKDFLKLEDIRKWLSRHKNKLGGLVTYPCTHEWTKSSDAYQYCSDKTIPTLMLPYKYLAYLLAYKDNYDKDELAKLWNYSSIFPKKLDKKMKGGNKEAYWKKIDKEISKVTNTSEKQFNEYMDNAHCLITGYMNEILLLMNDIKMDIYNKIKNELADMDDIDKIRTEFINYRLNVETKNITEYIDRINKFRM